MLKTEQTIGSAIHTNPHLRPVETGDISLLIEPHPQANITALRIRQQELYMRYGGAVIPHVHLSCQRVQPATENQLEDFLALVTQGMKTTMPFALDAVALHTLPVPALNSTMLKWRVDITDALRQFNAMIAAAMTDSGLTALYAPNFTSNLVSALRDMPVDYPDAQLQDQHLPYHLFDAAKVVLSQIHGPNDFRILATLLEG